MSGTAIHYGLPLTLKNKLDLLCSKDCVTVCMFAPNLQKMNNHETCGHAYWNVKQEEQNRNMAGTLKDLHVVDSQ